MILIKIPWYWNKGNPSDPWHKLKTKTHVYKKSNFDKGTKSLKKSQKISSTSGLIEMVSYVQNE